jgi:hypothetical protein
MAKYKKGTMVNSTKKRYSDAGKGSRRRDSIDQDKFEENWEKIFGKEKKKKVDEKQEKK